MTSHGMRVVAVAAALLAFVPAESARAQAPRAAEPRLRAFSVSPTVSMRVYVPAGRVRIVVWDRDSVVVAGSLGASASMFGGGNRDFVKLGIEPLRTGDTALPSADFTISVPRGAHLWVKMTDGQLEADGTRGELELYTVGGSIAVRHATGVVSVESIDAPVRIDSVSGDLRVRGGKGAVTLTDVRGTATVSTISGRITMTGAVPACRAETIGGDIHLDARTLRGSIVELQTHSGAIVIDAVPTPLPKLDLASRAGAVVQPKRAGSAATGTVIARSFKGPITVTAANAARR